MYHKPVLPNASVEFLHIKPDGLYVDVTFGGGGHSKLILEKLTTGRLIAFDQDADAMQNIISDDRLLFINQNFRYLENFLGFYQALPVDGIFADLGISSYQIDKPEKGFSYMFPEEKLDMRMNKQAKKTASQILNTYDTFTLAEMFFKYGELPFSRKLASQIEKTRLEKKFETIADLLQVIDKFVVSHKKYSIYSRVFQALRIEVNEEMEALEQLLLQGLTCLKPGGSFVVISYHSLEDRLVKNFFRSGRLDGIIEKDFYGNQKKAFKLVTNKPMVADLDEVAENPRARSAKLRAAIKL
jgi:16S rRNA (cytosine1402-N4)-methyltransferase